MRRGRLLIGPPVGVVVLAAALTGCGSSGSGSDSVLSPPTTEVSAATEAKSVTEATSTTPAPRPSAMTDQELAGLEAELAQIDAILAELDQTFAAD